MSVALSVVHAQTDTPTPSATPTPTATTAPATITVNATCSLDNAIKSANTNTATGGCVAGGGGRDIINITQNVTLAASLSDITSVLRINGGGFTIDGGDSHWAISAASGGDVAVDNVRITQTNGQGGALYVASGGKITATNVALDNGYAWNTGGAAHSSGELTIANSTIHSNTAPYGVPYILRRARRP